MTEFLTHNPELLLAGKVLIVGLFSLTLLALSAVSLVVLGLNTFARAKKLVTTVVAIAAAPGKSGKAKLFSGLVLSGIISKLSNKFKPKGVK